MNRIAPPALCPGRPLGNSPSIPGLYFLGLPWQHTWGSGRFSGVAADAHHLMETISARHHPAKSPVPGTDRALNEGTLGS